MTRSVRVVVGAIVAAVVVVAVYLVVADTAEPPSLTGVVRGAPPIFGSTDVLPPGPTRAVFAPDGSRLAVLEGGRVRLAEDGLLRSITREGSNVVDVAWFRNSDVMLIVEGPIPTGGVADVEADGTVRGSIPLDPSITFGAGFGMALLPGNRKAIVTATERPALSETEHRYLAEVDLETGKTRPLDVDGTGPHIVGEHDVLYTGLKNTVELLDLGDGSTQTVATDAHAVGLIRNRWLAYGTDDRVLARPVNADGSLGREQIVLDLPPGTDAVAVDPTGAAVLVVGIELTAEGDAVPRLRRVAIREPDRFQR